MLLGRVNELAIKAGVPEPYTHITRPAQGATQDMYQGGFLAAPTSAARAAAPADAQQQQQLGRMWCALQFSQQFKELACCIQNPCAVRWKVTTCKAGNETITALAEQGAIRVCAWAACDWVTNLLPQC